MESKVNNRTTHLVIKVLALLIAVGILAYVAVNRPTKLEINVKKKEGRFETIDKVPVINKEVIVEQKVNTVKDKMTGIDVRSVPPKDLPNKLEVKQEIKTNEGSVTGVDLSQTSKAKK